MKPYIYLLFLILLLSAAVSDLSAQRVVTLEECINMAVDRSILVNQGDINTQFAEISLSQAKQARYPNLSASSNLYWNFGRTIDPTSNDFITERFFSNTYDLNTGVILFDGFRIRNTIKKSEMDIQAATADNQQTKQDIALQTALNYLNVLFTKESITISKTLLAQSKNQLVQMEKSIRAGAMPASERLNVEAQIAQEEQGLINAKNNYQLALFQLKQQMRISPGEEIEVSVTTELAIDTDPDLLDYDEVITRALSNRYDLKAADIRAQSSEMDIDIAKAGYYPRVNLGGSLGTRYSNQAKEVVGFNTQIVETEIFLPTSPDPITLGQVVDIPIVDKQSFGTQLDNFLSYGFGFGLSIPIYDNGNTKAAVQRAELGVINQQLAKRQLTENFQQTVHQALMDARAAKRKLQASEKSLEAQKAAFENLTKRYEIGAANSFEWETQKAQMEQAEINKLLDKYDYLFKIKIIEFYMGKTLNF